MNHDNAFDDDLYDDDDNGDEDDSSFDDFNDDDDDDDELDAANFKKETSRNARAQIDRYVEKKQLLMELEDVTDGAFDFGALCLDY